MTRKGRGADPGAQHLDKPCRLGQVGQAQTTPHRRPRHGLPRGWTVAAAKKGMVLQDSRSTMPFRQSCSSNDAPSLKVLSEAAANSCTGAVKTDRPPRHLTGGRSLDLAKGLDLGFLLGRKRARRLALGNLLALYLVPDLVDDFRIRQRCHVADIREVGDGRDDAAHDLA